MYMTHEVIQLSESKRASLVKRGRKLEYFTIGYNSLEGLVAVGAGLIAGSIALVGFGFDSLIEVISGAALLWRLHTDVDEANRERVEAISLRIVGICFRVLAAYVSFDSIIRSYDTSRQKKAYLVSSWLLHRW
jgi:divalent metal cation (Fe/Co/Zn/Cd) transporter